MEIERKFLVKGDYRPFIVKSTRMVQGYLSTVPERTVRVRIAGDKGYLTIKGAGNATGVSRFEWEKEISTNDALELLTICEPGIIDKVRHLVKAQACTYEVDEFCGENEGLTIAEIELPAENAPFYKPEWIGEEVTGRAPYYNAMLTKNPFTKW
jgi:adenylate cyclase